MAISTIGVAAGGPPAPGPSSLRPMRPGTYRYEVIGDQMTSMVGLQPVSGDGTLTVDPASGSDQHLLREDPTGTTEAVLRYRGDGVYLTRLRMAAPAYTLEFEPSQPVAVLPLPAAVGRSWSWSALSVDGATTLAATFAVSRAENATVDSASEPAVVVRADLEFSGDVQGRLTQLVWRSVADGSVLRERQTIEGKAGSTVFRSDVRWALRSTSPA